MLSMTQGCRTYFVEIKALVDPCNTGIYVNAAIALQLDKCCSVRVLGGFSIGYVVHYSLQRANDIVP